MDPLLRLWDGQPQFESLLADIARGVAETAVNGLAASQKACLLAAMRRRTGRGGLIVTASLGQAERLALDLETFLPGEPVFVFPALEVLPFEIIAHSPEVLGQRLAAVESLLKGERPLIVAPLAALLRRVVPFGELTSRSFTVRTGDRLNLERVVQTLVELGYERVGLIETRGQFSVRGGILDVFPLAGQAPWRLELFGDEVVSIREFDMATQRSRDTLTERNITPATEAIVPHEGLLPGLGRVRSELGAVLKRLERAGRKTIGDKLRSRVEEALAHIETARSLEGHELYLPFFHAGLDSVDGYLSPEELIFIDEPARLRETAGEVERQVTDVYSALVEQGQVLPTHGHLYQDFAGALSNLRRRQFVTFSLMLRRLPDREPDCLHAFEGRPVASFHGQEAAFLTELGRWRRSGKRTLLVAATTERALRLKESLHSADLAIQPLDALASAGSIAQATGNLEAGFELPFLDLVVVTDGEVLGRVKRRRLLRAPREGARLTDYHELKLGDFVVHAQHGIGVYQGMRTITIDGAQRDYLFIRYAGEDRLYVPSDQIGLVQKYVGAEGAEPSVNKLGGTEWSRVKNRVKAAVQDMAKELLALYAKRQAMPGYAYGSDTVWQAEFEDAFKYEETPDQLHSSADIKRDMEQPRPMDRLLCGDVGYGKTEVAIRAAFKAVLDGKQVAVLVPTTILAQQHYNTFRERFAGYPVRIDLLSRFRSAKEQKATLDKLKTGDVDIVIGTHRAIQDDVVFRELGLLVVDEEHRFGVAHKERLKRLRETVDCLTLTATPIPRTLHMAMVGMRDMSVIETPPEDRFPVQTYVVEYSDDLVRDAIQREVNRGGQAYYVHNRVQTIDRVHRRLEKLLPETRTAVGHGQMKEDDLERVMLDFLEGQYEVLLCTTIIESGLDIANVNTIIIEDADHLGLAQLYQLRGRVGRSNRLAYCYLTYRRDKLVSETAEKRLMAIKEFTELGSGFKIALRDLEIRGAGNILGPEQHGHILAVGFDLYCQLLEEAINELKDEAPPKLPEATIELKADAFLPEEYVSDPRLKIEVYKRIVGARSLEGLADVQAELLDRYGPVPPAVANLLTVARLRCLCRSLGIIAVSGQKDQVLLRFLSARKPDPAHLVKLAQLRRGRLLFSPSRPALVTLRTEGIADGAGVLRLVEDMLVTLGHICQGSASSE